MSTRQAVKAAKPAQGPATLAGASLVARLPIEYYRLVAAALLIGLLGISLLAPLGPAAVPAAWTGTPTLTGAAPFDQVFDYHAPAEQQISGTPPRSALLRAAPDSARFRAALSGELQRADAPGGTPSPTRDELLLDNPGRWPNLETFYTTGTSNSAADFGLNGLGVLRMLQSTQATGAEQQGLLDEAANDMQVVRELQPSIWYYGYNWALVSMATGHFGLAAALLPEVLKVDSTHPDVQFMSGLAALRAGAPDQAIQAWTPLASASEADWSALAREGLYDAEAARGNVDQAAQGYRLLLESGSGIDWTLYDKLLRLEMQRGDAGAMLDMIAGLEGRVRNDPANLPRLLYDRGRILALLGRPAPAVTAFEQGRDLAGNDPAFHLALAQTLLASGNAARALPEAEAAIRAAGGDPSAADFGPAIRGMSGDDAAQRRARQLVGARLVQAAAWAAQGNSGALDAMAKGLDSLATSDAPNAGWYRYFALRVAVAAGRAVTPAALDAALAAAGTSAAGPARGLVLDAYTSGLTPAQAAAAAGDLLQQAGGSLADPAQAADSATAGFYATLAQQLDAAGRLPDAGPLYRAAAAWEQAAWLSGPISTLAPAGVPAPVTYRAQEASYLLRTGDNRMAIARYQQILALEPAAVGAWTNIGVAYARLGDPVRAQRGFEVAARLAPQNAQAQHNLGVQDYRQWNLPGAEAALGAANRAGRSANQAWGYDLVPAGAGLQLPAAPPGADFAVRLAALVALLLLLLHTLIPRRPQEDTAERRAAQTGLLGRLAAYLPTLRLSTPLALALALAVAGVAWAWAGSGNNPQVAVLLLVSGLVAAILAVGGQELAQAVVAGREARRGRTTVQVAPLGLLLAVLTAPLGLVYGWQIVTRAGAADGAPGDAPAAGVDPVPPADPPRARSAAGQPARGGGSSRPVTPTTPGLRPLLIGWGAMGPQARVALAGLLANVVLALLCLAGYLLLGWPVWRLALLANLAVLAFTAVSEPPAEGWHVWRRAPLLWLVLFIGASAALTVFALGAA